MTPLEEIYNNVCDKVRTLPKKFRWFDLDMGQLEESGNELPIEFPAVLLKFEDVIWKTRPDGVQLGIVNVTVKLAFQFIQEEQIITAMNGRQEVRDCLTTLFKLHDLLNLMHGTLFSQFRRYNQYHKDINPKDLIWQHILQYQCNIQDNGTIDEPNNLIIDINNVIDNNSFMERKKFNLIHK